VSGHCATDWDIIKWRRQVSGHCATDWDIKSDVKKIKNKVMNKQIDGRTDR
jgi:hypothetical protein